MSELGYRRVLSGFSFERLLIGVGGLGEAGWDREFVWILKVRSFFLCFESMNLEE